jgi:hypothetical protein
MLADLACSVHRYHNRRIAGIHDNRSEQEYSATAEVELRLVGSATTLFRDDLLRMMENRLKQGGRNRPPLHFLLRVLCEPEVHGVPI